MDGGHDLEGGWHVLLESSNPKFAYKQQQDHKTSQSKQGIFHAQVQMNTELSALGFYL